MPGRGRDIEDYISPCFDEFACRVETVTPAVAPEILVVPDILADSQADLSVLELHDFIFRGRLEVAVFIKYVVGRPKGLVTRGGNLSFVQQGDRVARFAADAGLVAANVPDDQAGF